MGDPREQSVPDVGFLTLRDAETDELLELDTRHPRVRARSPRRHASAKRSWPDGSACASVDRLEIRTDQPYSLSLQKFFRMRERQR